MAQAPSPLVGFNNNVKHKGQIFHVQTEDFGVKKPQIVTHLFADGGRIIRSTRTDYSEHLGRNDMSSVVRRMMKEQHKAMFIALRDGQLDPAIDQITDSPAGTGAREPSATPPPEAPRKKKSRPPPTLPDMVAPRAGPGVEKALPGGRPAERKSPPTLTDMVLKDLSTARPREAQLAAADALGRPQPRGTPTLGTPAVTSRPPPGRYAAARPAAIFAPGARESTSSIFGGSSISEQSLDEVILSYLAEDLDGSTDD